MIDRVEALMREVAAEAVLPRYQRLSAEDVQEKGPGDLVTAADRAAEDLLTARLSELVPGSLVVGEEAVAADPGVMSRLGEPGPVWVVDPIDGTSNYAAGRGPFAIMVGLLQDSHTVAGWILDPISGVAAVAEKGSGAFLGGDRIVAPRGARPAGELRGPAFTRYTPPNVKGAVSGSRETVGEVLPGRNCAGYEYPAIARDEQQFALFWRMLPWDHAPGVLFIEEAGGVAWHLDGTPYEPAAGRVGVLVAQNPDVWQTVRQSLLSDIDTV